MKKKLILLLALLACLVLIHGTCWGETAWVTLAEENADAVLFSTATSDDRVVARWEYRSANIKTAQDTDVVPFLFPSDKINIKEIETFLSERNMTAAQLAEYLGKYRSSLREFIDHADGFGTNTALFIELLDGLNKAAAEQGVGDFFSFLRFTDTSIAEFVEVMGQVYGEEIVYLSRMDEYDENLDEWYAGYLTSGAKTFAEWLGADASNDAKIGPRSPIAAIVGVFSIIGIVYDIIKSTNVVRVADSSTRILHKDDPNSMNYGGAKINKTPKVRWWIKNFAGVICYDVTFHAESAYDAKHSTIPGHFLPRIKVVVDKVQATFPWSVDAKVLLDKNLANVGTVAVPDPQGKMDVHVNCHWQFLFFKGFDNRHLTLSFTGSSGIIQD